MLAISACVRSFTDVQAEPEFLGEASGIYLARDATNTLAPRLVNVVEVSTRVLVSFGALESSDTLPVIGTPVRRDDGLRVFTNLVEPTVEQGAPDIARLFPALAKERFRAQLEVTIGFDAVTLKLTFPDAAAEERMCDLLRKVGAESGCKSLTAGLTYEARKVCDFDARLAGVYSAKVKQTSGDGRCAELAGERRWVLVVTPASPVAVIASLASGDVEFGALATFEPARLELSLATAFQLGDRAIGPGFSLSARLGIGESATTLEGELREGSCTFSVTAERLSGTKKGGGLNCTTDTLCDASASAACPVLPGSIPGIFVFEGEAPSQGFCPQKICKLIVPLVNACSPQSIAAGGCPLGYSAEVAAGTRPNGEACYNALCAERPECAALTSASGLFASSCPPGTLVVRRLLGCSFAVCP